MTFGNSGCFPNYTWLLQLALKPTDEIFHQNQLIIDS